MVLTHRDERALSTSSPRVSAEPLMREAIDLVRPTSHRLAHLNAVTLGQLADEDWISVRGGFPVDDVLLSVAKVTGLQPRVVQRVNDFQVMQALVAAGHGVALMPHYSVTHGGLKRCVLAGIRAGRIYELATRPRAAEVRPSQRCSRPSERRWLSSDEPVCGTLSGWSAMLTP